MREAGGVLAGVRGVVARPFRGAALAIGSRPGVFALVTALMVSLSVLVPPLVLSLVRKPVDYFTFNPWLKRLSGYLTSPAVPLEEKLRKLPELALFWFSADSPMGGIEWGFAVDVKDLGRILFTALLVGTYFSLWIHRRQGMGHAPRPGARSAPGGAAGALLSVLGLSTGPCSVMGCGAPVLPVIGLAVAGLSSGTLQMLARVSTVATAVVIGGLAVAVLHLGWLAGGVSGQGSGGWPGRRGRSANPGTAAT